MPGDAMLVRSTALLVLLGLVSVCPAAEPIRLTSDGRMKADPVVTPSGESIIFTTYEVPTLGRLMRLTLADKSLERFSPQAETSEFEATCPADGSAWAFIQSRGNLNLRLVIRDSRTGKDASFEPGGGFASLRRPSFTPDGTRIIFSIPAPNGQEIVSVNRQGQDRKSLTSGGMNTWPAVSPDGKQIAFVTSREGEFDLAIMNIDGTGYRRLLRRPGMDARPAWSPDGKRIAFMGAVDGNYNLFLVDADGSHLTPLVSHPERDDFPTWHPDGKRVIFVGERNGKSDLYSITVPELAR